MTNRATDLSRNVYGRNGMSTHHSRRIGKGRRARVCQLQRQLLLLFGAVLLLTASVLLGSSIVGASRSNASDEDVLYKYYTSVEVQQGDTLWTIADQYMQEDGDRSDYIQELKEINQLQDDIIHAGDFLTVAYYSNEFK